MPFTEEERAAWKAAKRVGQEHLFDVDHDTAADFEEVDDTEENATEAPLTAGSQECLNCGCLVNGNGSITDVAICDTCMG